MITTKTDTALRPPTERLKPVTDRITRERSEHPDRIPAEGAAHPVTSARPTSRREQVGGGR
jgi:hypothetical protein